VQDCQSSTRVFVEPMVEFEDIACVYDEGLAICNATFNLPGRDDAVSVHCEVGREGVRETEGRERIRKIGETEARKKVQGGGRIQG
jgi:hypothetical protein